jgi:hypothetical protein
MKVLDFILFDEGETIYKTDKERMHLWETVFDESNREHLIRLNDSHSRRQIDARNSNEKYKDLYCHVTKMYNNISWIPMSSHFTYINERLGTSFPLQFISEDMTEQE